VLWVRVVCFAIGMEADQQQQRQLRHGEVADAEGASSPSSVGQAVRAGLAARRLMLFLLGRLSIVCWGG
jgi:hypothetical protein